MNSETQVRQNNSPETINGTLWAASQIPILFGKTYKISATAVFFLHFFRRPHSCSGSVRLAFCRWSRTYRIRNDHGSTAPKTTAHKTKSLPQKLTIKSGSFDCRPPHVTVCLQASTIDVLAIAIASVILRRSLPSIPPSRRPYRPRGATCGCMDRRPSFWL